MSTNTSFQTAHLGPYADLTRVMLQETLGTTGMEVSVNRLEAGQTIPFIHTHQENEELYLVLKGKGSFWVDETLLPLSEGSVVRVAPRGQRVLKAGDEDLVYLCIQAREGSLRQATRADGSRVERPLPW